MSALYIKSAHGIWAFAWDKAAQVIKTSNVEWQLCNEFPLKKLKMNCHLINTAWNVDNWSWVIGAWGFITHSLYSGNVQTKTE